MLQAGRQAPRDEGAEGGWAMDRALADYAAMLGLARRLTRDDPEDICQDVFVALCAHPPAIINRSYLLAAVRMRFVDRLRRDARHAPAATVLEEWTPGAVVAGPEGAACDRETLAEVAALPGADLLLAEAAGWSQPEIAAHAGITANAVGLRLHRLRHGLLARISPWA
jgi:DNA-directed RNA polymerase specialized sigma24 family protein